MKEEARSFLSQGQESRFDRWVEFFGALVMSLATVIFATVLFLAILAASSNGRLLMR